MAGRLSSVPKLLPNRTLWSLTWLLKICDFFIYELGFICTYVYTPSIEGQDVDNVHLYIWPVVGSNYTEHHLPQLDKLSPNKWTSFFIPEGIVIVCNLNMVSYMVLVIFFALVDAVEVLTDAWCGVLGCWLELHAIWVKNVPIKGGITYPYEWILWLFLQNHALPCLIFWDYENRWGGLWWCGGHPLMRVPWGVPCNFHQMF